MSEWIPEEVPAGMRIGADPTTMPNTEWEELAKELNEKLIYLIPVKKNLVELIWPSRTDHPFHEATTLLYENSGTN